MRRKRRSDFSIDFGYWEITLREILASVSIVAVLFTIGFAISGKISDYVMDKNEVYNKAVKIESRSMFEYGMRTNVGNAFVYGDLEAIDTVTYPEIDGEYMYAEKVKEVYTMHTRQVAHTRTVNGHTETYYTTEVYWSWDYAGSEHVTSQQVRFCGVTFPSSKIKIPSGKYLRTIYRSSHVRYNYYVTETKHTGTIFTELKDNTISEKSSFYKDRTIDEAVTRLQSRDFTVTFWVCWIIFIVLCVVGFYYLDNRWLE